MNSGELEPKPVNSELSEKPANMLPGDVADLLISRVVDGVATARDWDAFQSIAGSDIVAWRELAMSLGSAQSDQTSLSRAVEIQAASAALVGLPSDEAALRPIEFSAAGKAWSFVRGGLGWVAAAALALAVYSGRFNQSRVNSPSGSTITAGLGAPIPETDDDTSKDLLNKYLDRGIATGEVLGELPDKLMLQAQPVKLADGSDGYEVVFVRQIVERAQLRDLYQMQIGSRDELGREKMMQVPVRVQKPRKGST